MSVDDRAKNQEHVIIWMCMRLWSNFLIATSQIHESSHEAFHHTHGILHPNPFEHMERQNET